MTRIVICGGPRTGKTTLARELMWQEIAGWLLGEGVSMNDEGVDSVTV